MKLSRNRFMALLGLAGTSTQSIRYRVHTRRFREISRDTERVMTFGSLAGEFAAVDLIKSIRLRDARTGHVLILRRGELAVRQIPPKSGE